MACITANPPVQSRTNPFARIATRWSEWENRRALHRVLKLDSHVLRDIGLTHGDVETALTQRLTEDAGMRLMATRNPHMR